MSQSVAQAKALWRLREDISETITRWTPYKNDISSTVSKVPELLSAVDEVVHQHYPDWEVCWYGHIGDGNLHLNILKPDTLDIADFKARCGEVSIDIFKAINALGGSVSAEHGVGTLKAPYLEYTRSESEIASMRAIKAIFDPDGIMNPANIFHGLSRITVIRMSYGRTHPKTDGGSRGDRQSDDCTWQRSCRWYWDWQHSGVFIAELPRLRDRIQTTVSSSERSSELLRELGFDVKDLNDVDRVDVYIDGADESTDEGFLIKGGGAALTREKIAAAKAKEFICIADNSKMVSQLGVSLPVEVIPMARTLVQDALNQLGGMLCGVKVSLLTTATSSSTCTVCKLTIPRHLRVKSTTSRASSAMVSLLTGRLMSY